MAEDINSLTIIGRLCADAELSYTNSGAAKTKGSIAVNRSRKDGDQWIEEASFFNFELWGRRGESLNQYLSKGTRISISGSLKQDRWEQEGQKRSRVYIHCEKIQLLGGNQNNDSQGNNGGNGGGYNQSDQGNNSMSSNQSNNRSGGGNNNSQSNNQSNNNNSSNNQQRNNDYNPNNDPRHNKPSHENYPSGNQGGGGDFESDIPF